jgi:hypothetical protein
MMKIASGGDGSVLTSAGQEPPGDASDRLNSSTYTFLAINGAQLTTGLDETLNFVFGRGDDVSGDFDRASH